MTPTPDGRFCSSCQHEVVDFSHMSEAEVTAWLSRPSASNVCGFFRAEQFASVVITPQARWRRWLVAAIALLGLEPLLVACQSTAPKNTSTISTPTQQSDTYATASEDQITIRGRVLEDSTDRNVAGAEIFIGETKYGAVADDQGNFSFTMPREWEPVQNGTVVLHVQAGHFTFERLTVEVPITSASAPLVLRLHKYPVAYKGKIAHHNPPRRPPRH
jgi:hypothetical protein